jgi:hypothetical protein
MYKESDFHGSDKHLGFPPSAPQRRAKGDLGLEVIDNFAPRALSHSGMPWSGMKRGQ